MGSSLRSVCEALWLQTQPDGYPLEDWVADQRSQPGRAPWRTIAADLRERTDGAVDLPAQTLINWYAHVDEDREHEAVA